MAITAVLPFSARSSSKCKTVDLHEQSEDLDTIANNSFADDLPLGLAWEKLLQEYASDLAKIRGAVQMAALSQTILALRRDPRLLKVPPYFSALCVVVGIVWLFLLPLNEYSRQTYISENALLPGQVHTYFGGSEQSVYNAYRYEIQALEGHEYEDVSAKVSEIFTSIGLKVASQRFNYQAAGNVYTGENVYSILHAPRGDATEAIVLVAPWKNMDGEINRSGLSLVLTLARYFKRWSLWSKDIIFLFTADSNAGPQAWADAYHDAHDVRDVQSLTLKSGALQGVVVVDKAFDHRFESLHVVYDGVNGQLPNLDLFNTIVSIASGQMGIGVSLQRMWKHADSYKERLQTMLRGMASQGLGHVSGPHSSFIAYHVDAVTIQAVGEGWQDEMAMGRVIESTFRSLNNLLEHFHQSFFFYLLMQANRFVSIGTYLPSAMLVSINFTIMAMSLWVQSGRPASKNPLQRNEKSPVPEMEIIKKDNMVAMVPKEDVAVLERHLFHPLALVSGLHFLGAVPLYIFNNTNQTNLLLALLLFTISNLLLPTFLSTLLSHYLPTTRQQRQLIKCFSLLLLGMFLATLSTLNFSLGFLIGILSFPLSFFGTASPTDLEDTTNNNNPLPSTSTNWSFKNLLVNLVLHALSPPVVFNAGCHLAGVGASEVLAQAAFGWRVSGLWTQVVVWCIWWPAWLVGAVFVSPTLW